MMMESGAAPCLSCQTEGGYASDYGIPMRPMRLRGLCWACYQRARSQGILTRYPACGAIMVPFNARSIVIRSADEPWQPAPWGRVPFEADPEPQPSRWAGYPPPLPPAPIAHLNHAAHARIIAAETFAATWLARHITDHPTRRDAA